MSETTTGQSGIDTMTAEDTAMLDSMRDDGPEPVDTAPVKEADPAEPELDLDLDDDTPPEPAADGKVRMVPHGQFHAANERRKAAEAARVVAEQKLATSNAVIEERLRLLTEVARASTQQAVAPPPVEIPDVSVDPVGHFQMLYQETARKVDEQAAILRGFQEARQQEVAVQELKAWAVPQEAEFTKTSPDFYEAMNFLRLGRHAELEAIGITSQAERDKIIMGDITQVALKSRADNSNYAERLYKTAVARGYAKAKAAPVIPPLDADTPPPDRTAMAERGRQSATTIASVGSAAPVRMSVDRIVSMSDRQFAAHLDKIGSDPAALRELMGD
jgi:hypothetical protein